MYAQDKIGRGIQACSLTAKKTQSHHESSGKKRGPKTT